MRAGKGALMGQHPAAAIHTLAPGDTSGTRRIIHFGIFVGATDVAHTHIRLYGLDRLRSRIVASTVELHGTIGESTLVHRGAAIAMRKTIKLHSNLA